MANNTTDEVDDGIYLQLPLGFTIFELSLQILIGLFGSIGNAISCAAIIRRPKVFSAMSHYLLSLALADLGVLMFILPLTILRAQFPFKWVLGRFVCLYVTPCLEAFYGASVWSITIIAVERYANIAWKEIRIGGRRSLKRSRLIINAVWLVSFATRSIPLLVHVEYYSSFQFCINTLTTTSHRTVVTMNFILHYLLPLSIIAFCYRRIGNMVSRRTRKFQDETTKLSGVRESSSMVNSKAILHQTKKTQQILRPLVVLFALTMLPLNVFDLVGVYWPDFVYVSFHKILISIVAISTFTNSAADPLIYCAVSREFRTEVKSLLPHCFQAHPKKRRQSSSSSLAKTTRLRETHMTRVSTQSDTPF
ncbi:galanin receptor type 1-like [Stylophora pistillata]|uniref:Neuromedin-U receptor 2 n=1 Tax=Stylophora pistillata TaxID=50429 RepID=A0A2B4SPE8_STYPI|nr:galanin receptor type 1-like [Stylophora pistillata]PFX30367.1 Neuromedin-U receptor 2 [Stylophora pistillata]